MITVTIITYIIIGLIYVKIRHHFKPYHPFDVPAIEALLWPLDLLATLLCWGNKLVWKLLKL